MTLNVCRPPPKKSNTFSSDQSKVHDVEPPGNIDTVDFSVENNTSTSMAGNNLGEEKNGK